MRTRIGHGLDRWKIKISSLSFNIGHLKIEQKKLKERERRTRTRRRRIKRE